MKERLENIPTRENFSHNGINYFILRREGAMSEVEDERGRKWAWPNEAEVVLLHAIEEAFKHPIRKAN